MDTELVEELDDNEKTGRTRTYSVQSRVNAPDESWMKIFLGHRQNKTSTVDVEQYYAKKREEFGLSPVSTSRQTVQLTNTVVAE